MCCLLGFGVVQSCGVFEKRVVYIWVWGLGSGGFEVRGVWI